MTRLTLSLLAVLLAGATYAETIAITGATVHTVGPAGTLQDATVLMTDGRIAAVGTNVRVPDNAEIVDASGKIVTPGIVSPIGQLGLVEVSSSAGPADGTQRGTRLTAAFDPSSAYNPRSTLVAINRIEGVTSAASLPSPGGADDSGETGQVLAGQAFVVRLEDRGDLLAPKAAIVAVLGENGSGLAGGSRAGAFLKLKAALDEAIDFRQRRDEYYAGSVQAAQFSIADLEALQAVLRREIPMIVDVHRASDIERLLELATEYKIRVVISGGAEAWMLADRIAAADVPVIVRVTDNLPGSFDRLNARRGAATVLVEAGVDVALTDGESQTHNARNLTQSAGNAIADGLSPEAALRAITLTPAAMYGVDDRIGSIEVGKIADLVIWPADPFELTTYAEQVFIGGEEIPMQSRQTLLRDRYLEPKQSLPPAFRR